MFPGIVRYPLQWAIYAYLVGNIGLRIAYLQIFHQKCTFLYNPLFRVQDTHLASVESTLHKHNGEKEPFKALLSVVYWHPIHGIKVLLFMSGQKWLMPSSLRTPIPLLRDQFSSSPNAEHGVLSPNSSACRSISSALTRAGQPVLS